MVWNVSEQEADGLRTTQNLRCSCRAEKLLAGCRKIIANSAGDIRTNSFPGKRSWICPVRAAWGESQLHGSRTGLRAVCRALPQLLRPHHGYSRRTVSLA